jgi:phage-related protein (TIGR01555 family)
MSDLVSDQESRVLSRLRAFNLGLGTSGLGIIDGENEDFTMMGQPVNGLQGLLQELRTELAGSLNYPQSRLYGTAAGALASSETDERRWASVVHAWAISRVVPALTRYTEIMLGARGSVDLQDWRIKPNPIAAPDAKRDAEVRKINAETYTLFVQAGVLEPVEIRNSLFGGAEYNADITLDPAISASVASNQAAAMATEVQAPAGPAEPVPAPDAAAGAADFGGVA